MNNSVVQSILKLETIFMKNDSIKFFDVTL